MAAKKKVNLQTKFKPTAGYVFVEPLTLQDKTDSGIYLPETAKDKPQSGKVLAIGPEETTEHGAKRKSPVKVGDKIVYKKWGGNEIKIGTKEYLFVKFEDILAIEK